MSTATQIEANIANAPCRTNHFRPTSNRRLEHGASQSPRSSSRRRTHFPQSLKELRAAKADYPTPNRIVRNKPKFFYSEYNPDVHAELKVGGKYSLCLIGKRTQSGNNPINNKILNQAFSDSC